ncbi:MAG: VanZ family protein [Comamonadaceae bacterium]|nr:MAG: VanZ family protein [Comamonadaceae bacterium]
MLALMVLSLMPASVSLPSTGWDKSNHMLGFAVLAVLGHFAWPGRRCPMLLGLLAYGGLIEVLQSFTPDRLAEFGDLVADGAGLLVGEALATLYIRLVPARV